MKKIFLLVFCIFLLSEIRADSIPSFRFFVEPQYFAVNCMRLGVDLRMSENKWISVSPRLIMREKDKPESSLYFGTNDLLRVWGAGLDISFRKYMLEPELRNTQVFFSFGLGYSYIEPVYYRYMWVEYEEQGLNYTTYMLSEDKRVIHQPRAEITMGIKFRSSKGLFMELYQGGGIKQSFFDRYKGDPDDLYNHYWSYGYSGTYLLMNLRIGMEF